MGIKIVKQVPLPTSLSISSLLLLFSINSFVSFKPMPVPDSLSVPNVEILS